MLCPLLGTVPAKTSPAARILKGCWLCKLIGKHVGCRCRRQTMDTYGYIHMNMYIYLSVWTRLGCRPPNTHSPFNSQSDLMDELCLNLIIFAYIMRIRIEQRLTSRCGGLITLIGASWPPPPQTRGSLYSSAFHIIVGKFNYLRASRRKVHEFYTLYECRVAF